MMKNNVFRVLHQKKMLTLLQFRQGGGFMDMFGMMGELMGNMVSKFCHFTLDLIVWSV